ncbi:hypothetical protein DL766_003285 [Monosporascus sp. MC13-8B]|uniref:G-protein coupled receptors family 3 profile domain-containing protein n=1 Tax=Monosporascus cannonballus TaxID=155416 RepID=A0ABY0GVJ6_9PEZI|nr:hypothetical protein DL762_010077 [Monosporascus cannonballus]RYO93316.1 hypothetical protein DL763_004415 [Monosporascus cannonballus]RYP33792.1 hypothetical protein DL766_003285 [Monosporascus sp. MC13-8B]
MATPGATQALVAAFAFGILVNAASAAVVLFTKGHGSAIFRDRLRLALTIFLGSSALWALITFISTLIDTKALSACQITVTFSTIFDQVARIAIEQYVVLLAQDEKSSLGLLPQFLVVLRFIAGIVFVGFTRSMFQPTCVPMSNEVPLSISVIVMDAMILVLLTIQFLSKGSGKDVQERQLNSGRVKSFLLLLAGLTIWMGTSVTMLLGLSSIDLVFKTTVPAIGLVILIAILTLLSGFVIPRLGLFPRHSELPTSRAKGGARNLSSSDTTDYPPSRYGDVKRFGRPAISGQINPASGLPVVHGLGNSDARPRISRPILVRTKDSQNALSRIATVDLVTAARNEKRRREAGQGGSYPIAVGPMPLPSDQSTKEDTAKDTKWKDVIPISSASSKMPRSDSQKTTQSTEMLSVRGNALSSSTQLSPGADAIRRRSPQHPLPGSTTNAFEAIRPGESTVMLMNNIAYDNPNAVNSITGSQTNSIVHRPRPIPRTSDKDRQVFPAEISHRRTKSSGSVLNKKSVLKSIAGSPTQLPPLPSAPKSAGHILKPHPNNTQSMTFEEKMDFFYAPPLSAFSAANTSNRASSVSAMPPVLNAFIKIKLPPSDAIVEVDSRQRGSIMTNNSSVRTASVLNFNEVPGEMRRSTVLPAAEGHRDTADDSEKPRLPGIPDDRRRSNGRFQVDVKRKSSPVLPNRISGSSTITEENRGGDCATTWGSLHSAVAPVHLQQARRCARSTYIQLNARETEPRGQQVDPSRNDGPGEVVTVMLDSALHAETRKSLDAENRRSQKLAASKLHSLPPFHRRVGDECPTFSRRYRTRSRKMPPPAPLLLNGKGGKKAIIIQSTEPSPLDSAEDTSKMIEEQLQKLERANKESVRNERERMTLLHTLELEMGQQENKWQALQLNIKRDSVSTVETSPARNSQPTSTVDTSSQGYPQRFLLPERASRRSFLNTSSTIPSRDGDAVVTPSSRSSRNNRASIQQTRLAEAQIENMASTPELVLKHNNLNVLAVSKFSLGSPSPPDTDESEFDFEIESDDAPQDLSPSSFKTASASGLWEPKLLATATGNSGLWNAPAASSSKTGEHYELPALSVRVKARKNLEPLAVESSVMWQKNTGAKEDKPISGLWRERILVEPQQPRKTTGRSLATRPPRRSKRITLLPDILESPRPLDERGTLGIFQFPSGEKSEHGTIPPRPTQIFTALPGTMTTGGPTISAILEARSRRIENEENSLSTFFDDSNEDGGDNFDDLTGRESTGDEFDETTLWEIANLLRTQQVSTRNSLLLVSPCPSSELDDSVLDGYEDMLSGDEYDDEYDVESVVEFEMVCGGDTTTGQPAAVFFRPIPVQPLLWNDETVCKDTTHFGLPQPDNEVWNTYVAKASYDTHPRWRPEEILPIESDELWMPSAKDVIVVYSTGLWASTRATSAAPSQSPAKASLLWSKASQPPQSPLKGLFHVTSRRSDYRRTSMEPAALYMTRAPRVTLEPLQQLTTTGLWNIQESNVAAFSHRTVHQLWEKPAVIPMQQSEGLFDIRFKRVDYRNTSQIPAALSMMRKPSIRREPLAELTSRNLWVAQPSRKPLSTCSRPSLWTKTVAVTPEAPSLFRIDPERKVYRTTTAEPAALQVVRRPRQLQVPLHELESNSLWDNTGRVQAELDWLSISSTRPRSPSVCSVSSDSAPSSPLSDAFSIKTSMTRASSVAESTMSGANSLGRRHRKTFTGDAVPQVPELPKQFAVKNLDSANLEKPVRIPLRKLCLPNVAYPADWDAALREAVAASRPKRVARITATPQEWSAALDSAILASYPRTTAGQRPLWVKPNSSPAVVLKGMWTAATATGRSGVDASLSSAEVGTEPYRSRRTNQSTEASPDFGAQRLWRRGDHSPLMLGSGSHARDWLEDTTKRRFTRLQLRY